MKKISDKKLAKLGGKLPYSTIASPRKAVRKSKRISVLEGVETEGVEENMGWPGSIAANGAGLILESICDMQLAHLRYARFGERVGHRRSRPVQAMQSNRSRTTGQTEYGDQHEQCREQGRTAPYESASQGLLPVEALA